MRRLAAWLSVFASLGCGEILGLDGYETANTSSVATVGSGGQGGSAATGTGAGGSASLCGAYCQLVLEDKPMGYWRLGEGPGKTEAIDEMGAYPGAYAPRTGTLTLGQASLTSEMDTAARIDNDAPGLVAVRVDDGPYFPGRTTFTLEVWVKPLDVQYAAMIEKHDLGLADALEQGYVLTYDAPNLFRFGRIANDDYDTITAPLPVVAAIYHVVATYDGNDMCLFVNGEQKSCAVSPLQLVAINRPLAMGREMSSGVLDEVAVYNSALSQEQIAWHYRVGQNGR
ncbi:MAG TPA: LamG domain-containing protein [Polyangiaceae bacterium]|nr:LamG domain-containing protein [Polyangiaceae bacterium]